MGTGTDICSERIRLALVRFVASVRSRACSMPPTDDSGMRSRAAKVIWAQMA
jgi:hypothetical protein